MVHTDVRYDCELCNKTYKAAQSLKAHVEIAHEGKPKPSIRCPVCDKSFESSTGVKRHVSAVHEKKRPFQCEICLERFAQKGHLVTHKKGKHKIL